MKAILVFKLPEDKESLESAQHGEAYRYALTDLLEECRKKLKYSELSTEEYSVYEWVQRTIRESLDGAPL